MKKYKLKLKITIIVSLFLFLIIFITSCDTDVTPTLYQDLPNGATPIISTINPPDSGLAGITTITINGQNFISDPNKTIVYFNQVVAKIDQISETQIILKAPILVKDSIKIKIAVSGSPKFSEPYIFHLKAATFEIMKFQDFELPYAITTDKSNNLYFNLISLGLSTGIKKITPAGILEDFSLKGGESFYTDIRYGWDGNIYGTRNPPVRALFKNEFGKAPTAIAMQEQTARLLTFDIDNNYNIWVGGSGGNIYRIKSDGVDKKSFPFEGSLESVRFFDGYLYAAATINNVQSIIRFQVISSDELGNPEQYYDLSSNLSGYKVQAITFSKDGSLFMGTSAIGNDPNALVVLSQNKEFSQWYPGVIYGPISNFAWNNGNYLYYIRQRVTDLQQQTIIKINMGILGAPYYGRD